MADQKTRLTISGVLADEATEEKVRGLIRDLLDLKKHKWGFCPKCRLKVQIEQPDIKGLGECLRMLVELTEGKSGTVDGEPGGVTIVVNRVWPDRKAA